MAGNEIPPHAQGNFSLKALRAKWDHIFEESLKDIFEAARISGFQLNPDEAMAELDDLLESALKATGGNEVKEDPAAPLRPAFRLDFVAVRRKIHHRAVDLFYNTYFPRKLGTEGKPRRGAPQLPREHLDRILQLRRKGVKPFKIADILGQPKDRTRKQIKIAEKRYCEAVSRVRELGAAQWHRLGIAGFAPEQPALPRKHRGKPKTFSSGK